MIVSADLLELRVADDGVGLPDEVTESGLRNARRRAADLGGTLEVSPVGERGTVLVWRVPLGLSRRPRTQESPTPWRRRASGAC